MPDRYLLNHFELVSPATRWRLQNLGLTPGNPIRVIQRYPFHGPVIIESAGQRIGIRFRDFALLTTGGDRK